MRRSGGFRSAEAGRQCADLAALSRFRVETIEWVADEEFLLLWSSQLSLNLGMFLLNPTQLQNVSLLFSGLPQ